MKTKRQSYTGISLYEGPSLINGEPIVAIATLHSENVKTGDMVQTWVLHQDYPPQEAVKEGADEAVCGQCKHRHYLGGACYVLPWQGPGNVYRSWKAGHYPEATRRHFKRLTGRAVRLGSYGDPAAVPIEYWQPLIDVASIATGYTHQENHLDHCMVSADTADEAKGYQSKGLRTFRVKSEDEPLLEGEVQCPTDKSDTIQCLDCGLCSGATQEGPNIAVNVHGSRKRRYADIIKTA